MAQRMVILKNMMNATVSVKKPEYGVNRRWDKRGRHSVWPPSESPSSPPA